MIKILFNEQDFDYQTVVFHGFIKKYPRFYISHFYYKGELFATQALSQTQKDFLSPRRESNLQPSYLQLDAQIIELPGLR